MEVNREGELCAEVSRRGGYFMELEQTYDCEFLLGIIPNQVAFSAHKLILAMASPVFEAMFYGAMSVQSEMVKSIKLVDIQPEIFQVFLRYIYTSNLNINSVEEACELINIGTKYMMENLVKECNIYLRCHVDTGNIWQIYEHGRLFQSNELLQKCEQVISTNTKDVLKNSQFEFIGTDSVKAVFSLETLNIDNEVDLVEAAARYVKARSRSMAERSSPPLNDGMPMEFNDKIDVANKESSVNAITGTQVEETCSSSMCGTSDSESDSTNESISLIENIRFLSLTPQQFAECSSRSLIMPQMEQFAVMMNIASNNCDVPMPKGFSKRRSRRHRMEEIPSGSENEGRPEAEFAYTIQDFHNVQDISFPYFYVQNLPWYVKHAKQENRFRFYVVCKGLSGTNMSCHATLIVTFFSQHPDYLNNTIRMDRSYSSKEVIHGCELNGSEQFLLRYVKDGVVQLQVQVRADPPQRIQPK